MMLTRIYLIMSTPQNYIMMFSEILCKDFSNDESGFLKSC